MRNFSQRAARLFILSLLPLFLTSCFVIEENYTFNADGSGQMEFIFDMSQLLSFLPEDMDRDSLGMGQMSEAFVEMENSIADMPGISNVNTINDEENLRFGVSYNFKDKESLNEALNTLLTGGAGSSGTVYISQVGNVYGRLATEGGNMMMEALKGEIGDEEEMGFLFSSMKYKVNMKVPKAIRTIYAESEFSQADNNSISFEYGFDKLSENPDLIGTTIVTQ